MSPRRGWGPEGWNTSGPPWWTDGEARPRWWPEGEAWPPQDRRARWRSMRRRFIWPFAIFALLFVSWLVGGLVLMVWLVGRAIGHDGGPPVPLFLALPGAIVALVLLIGFLAAGRAFRSMAGPGAEIVEALDRVAEGDHATRVRERGPAPVRSVGRAFNKMASRLERAEDERRKLLADVTHELRTPLTALQAQTEGLLDGVYPRDDEHIAPILDQARVMARLIDDLRTVSLAESGALTLHREPTEIAVLLERAAANFAPQAGDAGVSLRVEAPRDVPPIDVDPVRIGEVLANLIANSLRHTPRGGGVALSAERDAAGGIWIAVRDTGSGIPADVLPHVFDRFYRAGGSRGSGLGLAIAKGIVESHGGEITADSAGPDEGTTVRFTLPEN
jgi:two-component system sensor histidine kinase BaeS